MRAAACLLDLVLLAVCAHLFAVIDVYVNQFGQARYFGAITGLGAVAAVVYCAVMEAIGGASPGKRIMGVVIAEDGGRAASRGALVRRAAVKFCPLFLGLFPVIVLVAADGSAPWHLDPYIRDGLVVLAVIDIIVSSLVAMYVIVGCFRVLRPDRQAFHDQLAGTAVFRAAAITGPAFTPIIAVVEPIEDEEATEAAI